MPHNLAQIFSFAFLFDLGQGTMATSRNQSVSQVKSGPEDRTIKRSQSPKEVRAMLKASRAAKTPKSSEILKSFDDVDKMTKAEEEKTIANLEMLRLEAERRFAGISDPVKLARLKKSLQRRLK